MDQKLLSIHSNLHVVAQAEGGEAVFDLGFPGLFAGACQGGKAFMCISHLP